MTRIHTRGGLVAGLLGEAFDRLAVDRTLHVVDCGGGSGSFAVPLASSTCEVTVVDTSVDALSTLRRRADEAGVAAFVHAVNGDVEMLSTLVTPGSIDVVLAHGVLDVVDDVLATLGEMAAVLRPGGLLSLLLVNPEAAVIARALAGDPVQALVELRALDDGGRPRPEQIEQACREHGLVAFGPSYRHGIGVFSDVVPGAALDSPGAREAVRDLDIEASDRSPFVDLAPRVHLLFGKPDAGR